MMPEEKVNFANQGDESFNLTGELDTAAKAQVTLTIDEQTDGIVLDQNDKNSDKKYKGVFAWYHRLNHYFISKAKVKVKEKATFFHLLAVMINSGIPMVRALKALVSQLEKSPNMQDVVENLALKIESGSSLSVAMINYPKVFSEAEIGMIQSGEASGQLSRVLDNLASDSEKSHMIGRKVRSALMYPFVIFFLLIAVVVVMMIYVVPKLTSLFESFGGDLPLITKIVVGISDFFINNGVQILVALVLLGILFNFAKKTKVGRYAVDNLKLKVPIFGNLLKESYLAKFARSLSNLIDSNVSIVRTLEITANSIGNEVYKKRLLLSVEDIKQGIPLAENLADSDLFPPMLVNMIDVGEQTAQLDEITGKVAKFYEEEVDTAVAGFSKIIEPVILAVVGLCVGTIVAAIMIPIMRLSNLSGVI